MLQHKVFVHVTIRCLPTNKQTNQQTSMGITQPLRPVLFTGMPHLSDFYQTCSKSTFVEIWLYQFLREFPKILVYKIQKISKQI
jgi:hypothetical protein